MRIVEHVMAHPNEVTIVALGPLTNIALALRLAYVLGGILAIAVATGLYVGAGWGPGPRDGLMTGMAKRGVPVALARATIELTVLIGGWLLGGTVGIATVLFALLIGPLVKPALTHLAIPEERQRANTGASSPSARLPGSCAHRPSPVRPRWSTSRCSPSRRSCSFSCSPSPCWPA